MATLEPRLIPLIEMLFEIGLDWLALELVDGVQRSHEPLEEANVLALVRNQISENSGEIFAFGPPDSDLGVRHLESPLHGDAQLQWATRYIDGRLRATLSEMSVSLRALDDIIDSGSEQRDKADETFASLVLLDAEVSRKVTRAQVEQAQGLLGELSAALDIWLHDTRTSGES